MHLTADNISYVFVEGRQENIVKGGRKFVCISTAENDEPISSDTAVVEFYGKLVSVVCLSVLSLLVLLFLKPKCTGLLNVCVMLTVVLLFPLW